MLRGRGRLDARQRQQPRSGLGRLLRLLRLRLCQGRLLRLLRLRQARLLRLRDRLNLHPLLVLQHIRTLDDRRRRFQRRGKLAFLRHAQPARRRQRIGILHQHQRTGPFLFILHRTHLGSLRQRAFADLDIVVLQQRSLRPFELGQRVVVLGDGVVFLHERLGIAALDHQVIQGLIGVISLADANLLIQVLQGIEVGEPFAAVRLDALIPVGDLLILFRQVAGGVHLGIAEQVVALRQLQAGGADAGIFKAEAERHVHEQADFVIDQVVRPSDCGGRWPNGWRRSCR